MVESTVQSTRPEVVIKKFPGKFLGKHYGHFIYKNYVLMLIEAKAKFSGYFLWELEQIWNQTK